MLAFGNKRPCHIARLSWATGFRAPAVTSRVIGPGSHCFALLLCASQGVCSQAHISLCVDQQRLRLASHWPHELIPTKCFGHWVSPATHPGFAQPFEGAPPVSILKPASDPRVVVSDRPFFLAASLQVSHTAAVPRLAGLGCQVWVSGVGGFPRNFQSQVSTGLTTLAFISPQMVQGVVEAHVRLYGQHG